MKFLCIPKKEERKIWDKEYDDVFLKRFCEYLVVHFNAEYKGDSWGLWGAQEVTRYDFSIPDKSITVMTETYMGVTLCGEKSLVDQITEKASTDGIFRQGACAS
ncbi:hypothetical protein [Persicirhabdus sediminis]|uniref:Uncharacterized protein n=1 Tax=Persicirhabdus sediminis TaxID=454144 RepID=A0A8J7MCL9_9BACT|nr:hypothetical protein [Persicirhabdus sediminis]MBK1790692.1 hypothetical protein [Persicirhabdus sediminis]